MLGRLAGWPVGFVRPTGRPVDRARPALTGFFRTCFPGTLIYFFESTGVGFDFFDSFDHNLIILIPKIILSGTKLPWNLTLGANGFGNSKPLDRPRHCVSTTTPNGWPKGTMPQRQSGGIARHCQSMRRVVACHPIFNTPTNICPCKTHLYD